jgi:hypothetical protein
MLMIEAVEECVWFMKMKTKMKMRKLEVERKRGPLGSLSLLPRQKAEDDAVMQLEVGCLIKEASQRGGRCSCSGSSSIELFLALCAAPPPLHPIIGRDWFSWWLLANHRCTWSRFWSIDSYCLTSLCLSLTNGIFEGTSSTS